jgi:hypothetical protein
MVFLFEILVLFVVYGDHRLLYWWLEFGLSEIQRLVVIWLSWFLLFSLQCCCKLGLKACTLLLPLRVLSL